MQLPVFILLINTVVCNLKIDTSDTSKSEVVDMTATDQLTQGTCLRTFYEDCPMHWQREDELSGGIICRPPSSYSGSCVNLSISDKSIQNRKILETDCDIAWPCTNDVAVDTSADYYSRLKTTQPKSALGVGEYSTDWSCKKRNYLGICPLGFRPDYEHYTCIKDLYTGSCTEFSYQNATSAEKKQFAESCKTNWPCDNLCSAEFTSCPVGWTIDVISTGEILCEPPKDYKPVKGASNPDSCPIKKQSFKFWNSIMRSESIEKCGVQWPCRSGDCEYGYDFSQPCPLGWEIKYNLDKEVESCSLPSSSEDNTCKTRTFEEVNDSEAKANLIEKCGEKWPCNKATCEYDMDWSQPCPNDMVQSSKSGGGSICVSPSASKNQNSGLDFSNYSEAQKRKYAAVQETSWPCKSKPTTSSKSASFRQVSSHVHAPFSFSDTLTPTPIDTPDAIQSRLPHVLPPSHAFSSLLAKLQSEQESTMKPLSTTEQGFSEDLSIQPPEPRLVSVHNLKDILKPTMIGTADDVLLMRSAALKMGPLNDELFEEKEKEEASSHAPGDIDNQEKKKNNNVSTSSLSFIQISQAVTSESETKREQNKSGMPLDVNRASGSDDGYNPGQPVLTNDGHVVDYTGEVLPKPPPFESSSVEETSTQEEIPEFINGQPAGVKIVEKRKRTIQKLTDVKTGYSLSNQYLRPPAGRYFYRIERVAPYDKFDTSSGVTVKEQTLSWLDKLKNMIITIGKSIGLNLGTIKSPVVTGSYVKLDTTEVDTSKIKSASDLKEGQEVELDEEVVNSILSDESQSNQLYEQLNIDLENVKQMEPVEAEINKLEESDPFVKVPELLLSMRSKLEKKDPVTLKKKIEEQMDIEQEYAEDMFALAEADAENQLINRMQKMDAFEQKLQKSFDNAEIDTDLFVQEIYEKELPVNVRSMAKKWLSKEVERNGGVVTNRKWQNIIDD